MSKAKLEEARELIRAGRHNEARDILKTIDHPIARDWLQKLEKIAPDTRKTNYYAEEVSATNHPYEPLASEESAWMKSVKGAQSKLDTHHDLRVAKAKEYRAKQRRKQALFIGAVVLVLALLCKPLYDLATKDIRPILYLPGFFVFVGLPLRIMVWAGREKHAKPGIISAIVVSVITALIVLIIEYCFFLRSIRIYTITFDWYYLSSFLQHIGELVGLDQFLLYICALVAVLPTTLATDDQFGGFMASVARPLLPRWLSDFLLDD
ncbi:MAG: hypothetical protein U0694_19995 [Anaerolineae bacterium]